MYLKYKAASGLHSITMFSFFQTNSLDIIWSNILKHSRHAKHYAEHKGEMFLTTFLKNALADDKLHTTFLKNALADDKCITAMGTQYTSTQPSIVHAKTECNMSEHIYSVSIRTASREDYCIILHSTHPKDTKKLHVSFEALCRQGLRIKFNPLGSFYTCWNIEHALLFKILLLLRCSISRWESHARPCGCQCTVSEPSWQAIQNKPHRHSERSICFGWEGHRPSAREARFIMTARKRPTEKLYKND